MNVTLSPQQYDLLTRLSKVQERSRSAVLLELLETVTPVLERVVVAAEGAQRAQVMAREGLRESVERAEAAILPHVSAAMGQLDLLVESVQRGPGAPRRAPAETPSVARRSAAPRRAAPGPVTTGARLRGKPQVRRTSKARRS